MDLKELEQAAAGDAVALGLLREIRDQSRELELKRFGLAALWVEHHPYLIAAREEYEGDDLSDAPTIAVARAGQVEHPQSTNVDGPAESEVDGERAAPATDGSKGPVDPVVPRGLWRVEEFSIATVAAALGMGTDAAERLLLHADQLRTHLPQVFALVMAGQFTLWRAREAAAATLWLTPEACAFVDDQLAWAPRNYGRRQLDGLIKQALVRHMPRQLAALEAALADPGSRRVRIHHPDRAGGDAVVDARLGPADGRMLDDVLTHLASRMREQGIALPVDELRALALGDLARAAYGELPLAPEPGASTEAQAKEAQRPIVGEDPACEETAGKEAADRPPIAAERATSTLGADDADDALARTDGRGVPRGRILMYLHIDAADLWPDGLPAARPATGTNTSTSTGTDTPVDSRPRETGSGAAPFTREHLERVPVRVEGGGVPGGTIVTADQLAPMFYRPSSLDDLAAAGRTHRAVPRGMRAPDPHGLLARQPEPHRPDWSAGAGADGRGVPSCDPHSPRFEGPQVIVRPVIDLDEPRAVDTYTPTERMREQLVLSDQQCSFPFCTHSARSADLDHIHPWHTDGVDAVGSPDGGATCTCQLAPLCRYHHRVKTHARTGVPDRPSAGGSSGSSSDSNTPAGFTRVGPGTGTGTGGGLHPAWDYVKLGAGTYLWHGPRGLRLLRTPHGSLEIDTLQLDSATTAPDSGVARAESVAPGRLRPAPWEEALDAEWSKGTLAQALIDASDDTTISDRAELRRRAHAAALAESAAAFPDEPPF